MATDADHQLDNPVLHSLTGRHRHVALREGRAVRFHPDVGPFMAVPDDAGEADWRDLARISRGAPGLVFRPAADLPADWQVLQQIQGFQLLGRGMRGRASDEVVELGPDDMPEMCALAAQTTPGPFSVRTRETGTYLGIRKKGRLVAMAGERLQTDRWVEISAVCTHPDFRRRGYGSVLLAALVHRVRQRGKEPFGHVVAENAEAVRLYEELGSEVRRRVHATVAVPPAPKFLRS